MTAPPLTVVLPAREGLASVEAVLDALRPQALATGTEVIVVGPVDAPLPDGVHAIRMASDDIFALRQAGYEQARGAVVATGEDHAVPRPDWCAAIIRAHAEHPEVPMVVGCLANGTARTLAGRANFLAFAAPFEPPMPALRGGRPAPSSALSVKRAVLEDCRGRKGHFEAEVIPRLFADGAFVSDDRIVADHHQDHGLRWAVVNGYHSARSSYGLGRSGIAARTRVRLAGWAVLAWPRRIMREAMASRSRARGDLAGVAPIALAVGVGAALGLLVGPGRSPDRVA
ncbi:MAG TPA: hypothetical protein VHE83_08125 [Mycobacteriales bacterium]|nr:hypothetical protein [Mycobacteriales bacterium]